MSNNRWTKDQLKLAFHLYCQIPFGKLHSRNHEIVELAQLIGRTPSAVAMKLVNFASIDPAITATGRAGLGNASSLDREIWAEFNADWEGLVVQCNRLRVTIEEEKGIRRPTNFYLDETVDREDFTGETRQVITEQRIKQHFFRRAVLSSYRGRCCMSGLSEPCLLLASHIVPWSKDKANRLNPSNGLCLSALHDRAFDKGLITLAEDFTVIVSKQLLNNDNDLMRFAIAELHGRSIELPDRFFPSKEFIARHRTEVFNSR
ncbi:HNH endonuclease [Desulfurivibrio dismutans]|uniref:HNH endonuclease n=1 Tax=Desulfurivibrio dismutans TaxID=1398908 RepID=UPI0023DC6744|nr:HNH endonuclease [Desulfurivibrio alkaliphilus]MDF1614189.1 HNH endonuclease [Desulfurivibrio alkaliphilus]